MLSVDTGWSFTGLALRKGKGDFTHNDTRVVGINGTGGGDEDGDRIIGEYLGRGL